MVSAPPRAPHKRPGKIVSEATMSGMSTDERVFYRDVKPYEVPARLEELRGPAHGPVRLPVSVYWGPDPVADLDTQGGVIKAYQAVLREGQVADQVALLNPVRLMDVWSELLLPARARALWESRFPQLASAT